MTLDGERGHYRVADEVRAAVRGKVQVDVDGTAAVDASDRVTVRGRGRARIHAQDDVTVDAGDGAVTYVTGRARVRAGDYAEVVAEGDSEVVAGQ